MPAFLGIPLAYWLLFGGSAAGAASFPLFQRLFERWLPTPGETANIEALRLQAQREKEHIESERQAKEQILAIEEADRVRNLKLGLLGTDVQTRQQMADVTNAGVTGDAFYLSDLLGLNQ